jgi:hypothetical protein
VTMLVEKQWAQKLAELGLCIGVVEEHRGDVFRRQYVAGLAERCVEERCQQLEREMPMWNPLRLHWIPK